MLELNRDVRDTAAPYLLYRGAPFCKSFQDVETQERQPMSVEQIMAQEPAVGALNEGEGEPADAATQR